MVLFGENVPVPEVDHIPPVAIVNEPLSVTTALLEHTDTLLPASAVGACVKVTVIRLITGPHAPLLVDVSVKVTLPAAVSAELGI